MQTREETSVRAGSEEGPPVSVVIPCYNYGHIVHEAIESVLAQTHPGVEVVVVDDGSTDNSSEVASRYAPARVVRQENKGVAEACNAGYRASRGEFIMFLGADDRLTPTAVESHLRCFAQHPEAGFVVGDIDHISEDGSYVGSPRWPLLEENQYEHLLKGDHVANTIAVMFRRDVFEKIGVFDANRTAGEDYDMILRAARSFPSAHHRNVVTQYRRHGSSMTCNGVLMLRSMLGVLQRQRPYVKGNRRLEAALRQGEARWRARFGFVSWSQAQTHFKNGEFAAAVRVVAAISGPTLRLVAADPRRVARFAGKRLGLVPKDPYD